MKLNTILNKSSNFGNISLLNSITTNNNITDDKSTFASILKQSINEVNDTQVKAYAAMHDIATGKVDNLQKAVQTIQSAELSLKLGLEVKNKAIGAYKQIMAMQI